MPRRLLAALLALTLAAPPLGAIAAPGTSTGATVTTAFDYSFPAIDGGKLDLAQYRGKVLLVVNTASLCGYTDQYAGLQKLWMTYGGQGLVVIAVPSNDFGGQEPGPEADIKRFSHDTYGVTFPLTAKAHVTGPPADPFYVWTAFVLGERGSPRWNFHKILIDRHGRPAAAFPSAVAPGSAQLIAAIERELAKP